MVVEAPPVQRASQPRAQESLQLPRARRMPFPQSALLAQPLKAHRQIVIGSRIAPYAGRPGCVRLCYVGDGGVLGHHRRALLRAEFRPPVLPRLAANVQVARQSPPAPNRGRSLARIVGSEALRVWRRVPPPERGRRSRRVAKVLAQLLCLGSCLEISCGASCARASNCA